MNQKMDYKQVGNLLAELDKKGSLFPQFSLSIKDEEPIFLGMGGFSYVYEMHNKERPSIKYAVKVIGFNLHTEDKEAFSKHCNIQRKLSQQSQYIMRLLDYKTLYIEVDESLQIVHILQQEQASEKKGILQLHFSLTEKLDELMVPDRFNNVHLSKKDLLKEDAVIQFACQIGSALQCVHENQCLHRDIKLENIFYDSIDEIYKLGDFGVSKQIKDSHAETVVYTNGYAAPEIEKKFNNNYNETADIYSFGITLYLLLNDLEFPGSTGYYPNINMQYNPEYVFPAPKHASVTMTRIIRKMCRYYPEDRYQSVKEVLMDLSSFMAVNDIHLTNDINLATVTYKEESQKIKHRQTRYERMQNQQIDDSIYREDSIKYFFIITLGFFLTYMGLQETIRFDSIFYFVPVVVAMEAIFQKLNDFRGIFRIGTLFLLCISMHTMGVTWPHIVMLVCVLIGQPMLTLSSSISTVLWMIVRSEGLLSFLDYMYIHNLGWIPAVASILMIVFFSQMTLEYKPDKKHKILLWCGLIRYAFLLMMGMGILFGFLKIWSFSRSMQFFLIGCIPFLYIDIFVIEDKEKELEDEQLLDKGTD